MARGTYTNFFKTGLMGILNALLMFLVLATSVARADLGAGEKDPGFAKKSRAFQEQGEALAISGNKVIRLGFSFDESFASVSAPTLYFIDGTKAHSFITPKGYECLKGQTDILATTLGDAEMKSRMKFVNNVAVIVEFTAANQRGSCTPYSVVIVDRLLIRPCFADDTFGVNPAVKECQLISTDMLKKQFARFAETEAKAKAIHEGLRQTSAKIVEALNK